MSEKRINTRVIHKHATEAVWNSVDFTPLNAELIVYDPDDTYSYPRFKLGANNVPLKDLPFLGMKPEYIEYLDNQLYQRPAILSFNILSSTTAEVGSSVAITSYSHHESNVGNIDGKLTLKKGSTVISSTISPQATSTPISYSDTCTSTTNGTVSYTLSGKNTRGESFSATDSISFYFPSFYGYSSSSTISSVAGLNKVASASLAGERSLSTSANGYVFFVSTTQVKGVTSGGFEVPLTTQGTMTVSINGVNKSYYVYRTNELTPGSLTYKIT